MDADRVYTRFSTFGSPRRPHRPFVHWPARPSWNQIRSLVLPLLEYEPMAHLPVLYGNTRGDLFFGEDAEKQGLFRNGVATSIFRAALLRRDLGRDPETLPVIYGPAVVFHRQVWDESQSR